jgi:hypothetical protein
MLRMQEDVSRMLKMMSASQMTDPSASAPQGSKNDSTNLVDQGLLIFEASRTNPDTPHSVGLLRTIDRPVAGTST